MSFCLLSTFSNDISSEAEKLIFSYFTYSIFWPGERIIVCFSSGRIRTLVAMVTNSSYRLLMGKEQIDFLCPQLRKRWGAYCFWLVPVSVCSKHFNASVLKFHTVYGFLVKNSLPMFFSCPNYLPLLSYAPFKV